MKKTLFFLLITGTILFTSLVFFINSPYFLTLCEETAGRAVGGNVGIGSLSFENLHALTVKDLVIKGGPGAGFDMTIPRLELTFRLRDLLRKHISGIILTGPELSVTVRKEETEEVIGPLPLTFDNVSLTDGRIHLHHETGRSFLVSRINLFLQRDTHTRRTFIRAGALLHDLKSEMSVDAIIDMEKLSLDNAHVDVPVIDLEMLSGLPYFTFIKKYGVRGTAGLKVDVLPQKNGPAGLVLINASLSARGLSAHSESLQMNLVKRQLNISFKGSHNKVNDRIDIGELRVELPEMGPWTAGGTLKRISSGDPDIDLNIAASGAVLKEIRTILSGPAASWLDEIAVSGTAGVDVSVTGNLTSPVVKGVISMHGEGLTVGTIRFGSFALHLPLDYHEGTFIMKDASVTVKELAPVPGGKAETVISVHNLKLLVPLFEYSVPEIKSCAFQVTADTVSVIGAKGSHSEKGIILKGSITENPDEHQLRFDSLSLQSDFIKTVSGSVSVRMLEPAAVDAALDYDDLDIEKLVRLFSGSFLQGAGPGARGQGKAHAGIKITFPEKKGPHVYGTLEAAIIDGGFSSADETVIGDKMKADISARFDFPVSLDSIDFSVSSEAAGFELLAGRFYGDFSDRAVHFTSEGRYTMGDDRLNIFSSKLGITGIGDLLMKGIITAPGSSASVDADITIPNFSAGAAFDFFLRETFRDQYPFLSRMRVGGQASMDVNVKGSYNKFRAQGELGISGMEIVDSASGSTVTGMDVSLPFDISFPEAGPAHAIDRFGFLRVDEIKWPPLQFSGLETFPAVRGNALVFQQDIIIPLYGGSVRLKHMSYKDILRPQRNLSFAADVEGINLAQIGKALDMPGFIGSVKGSIPSASFSENRFVTDGEIVLELFGGTIRVSGFAADNVFSPIASMRSDIELDNINLGMLTGAFEFGHISGMMKGELRDLVIVNGQAQGFNGHIETYREKGIPQRISVEALKKISILGTGSAASVLDQGIYRLFREYRYEQIGFRASLRNDNLLLLGAGEGDDSQYLVKGGLLPPKVDVITYNKNISFKELVSRLKRISQIDRKEGGN